jgi:hypothetical protein
MSNLPKIQDLYLDKVQIQKQDIFITLLNQNPDPKWVKEHPFIRGYKYLPIERVEYLLKAIFKNYKIEITGQGQSFNGVWVTVRVHYLHPITGEWSFHDGIGASQLQTAKGTSATDLVNINNGALAMAFPMAKTIAIKDACDHFGLYFGSDLNRKDLIAYTPDLTLIDMDENHPNWSKVVQAIKDKSATLEQVKSKYHISEEIELKIFELIK